MSVSKLAEILCLKKIEEDEERKGYTEVKCQRPEVG